MNEENKELKEKLASEIQRSAWDALQPHATREALICVAPALALLDVALAAVQDNKEKIVSWLEQGLLWKPTPTTVQELAATPDREFDFIIAQPFVFMVFPKD